MPRDFFGLRRGNAAAVVLVAVALGALAGLATASWSHQHLSKDTAAAAPITVVQNGRSGVSVPLAGFASIVKPLLPTVVNISTSKVVKPSPNSPGNFFFNDPMFQQFFGNQFGQRFRPRPQREHSLGSGVIVTADGYLLTNNHVIDGASDIQVQLPDQRNFTAKLIGTDPKTDIALLKINASALRAMKLGDSSQAQVGDIVLAIGDPFGVGETVTMGIVSATGRGGFGIEAGGYEDFIQTDAAINPGNSGGPLVDSRGECIAINTAILTGGGGGNQGVGFAIPINMARSIMDQLLKTGHVVRGYLGVTIQPVTPEIARVFGLPHGGGALIGDVTPGSPAAKAGIQKGDIILELNGQPISAPNDLSVRVSETAPGTDVRLTTVRNGQNRQVTIKLGTLPEKSARNAPNEAAQAALSGVQMETLTPDIAQELNLPGATRGVVVASVDPASLAAESGLQRGDVIQEVNRKPVSSIEDVRNAMAGTSKNGSVLLLVNRGGNTFYVVIGSE